MAGLSVIPALDQSEIDLIPEDVQKKLQSYVSTKLEEFNGLKLRHEKYLVNSEQQYFIFEKQLIACRGKLESESSQREKLREKLTEIESKHEDATKKLQELQENRNTFTTSEHEYKSTIQILENEKRDLTLLSNKKSKENDRQNDEVNELLIKLTTANNEKCEAQTRLNEQQSDMVAKEYKEKRLLKEKEQLETQVEWFNQQLTEKTNQLSSVRKEKTNHLLEVQAKLDGKTQEVEHLQAVVDSLKTSAEEQSKRTDSLVEKLKDERENQLQLEEQFRQELAVQKRLIDLYKASTEENDAKVTELTGAVEELRRLLKEASTSYNELDNSKAEEINRLETLLTEKGCSLSKLEDELKNANDLMTALKKGSVTLSDQAVESLSPSAAATSKLLKSGMSLTQIYNEYVQATDALSEEREENRRLNSYLEQILQEIEEKAPLLKRQREDYETALNNLDQMTSQLDTNMLECEKLRADADDMRRRFGHVKRESEKYQQTSVDLGKQVQHLLKEIEELRGGSVIRDDVNLSNVSSSSDIISEKLVTFRTIQELQHQNQRLIEVARDLSAKKEQEETEATTEKTRELKEQLDFAMTELENLREARTRQGEMVESIVRQRDMYRVLLLQDCSSSEIPPLMPVTSTPVHPASQSKIVSASPISRKDLEAARSALAELRSEYEAYKKDKAENDKVQSEMLEKMRQNVSELRLANTKFSTQLESATERYKIVQNNAAGFKKEADLLQERNQQASATILKHETAVANLKEDLMTAQENIARWQVQVENLRKEKELVSNSEMRHAMELESIRREQTSQTMLMTSLQAIQNNQERAEFEMKTRHQNQIEALEREAANLRRKLEASLEEKTRQAIQWEDIVRNVHLEIKQEKDKQAVLQSKADNAVLELETVKQELSTSEAKLAAAEIKIEKLSSRTDEDSFAASVIETEAVKDLKNQLAQDQLLIKSLRQQIGAAKKHASQYKTIAEDVENNIKDQRKSLKEIQDACEKKLQDANAAKDEFAKRIERLERDNQAALDENSRLSNEGQSLHGDLRKQLSMLQTELEEALTQKDLAVSNCEAAQKDCQKQVEIAAEAQDKYQRELMLHAADVEQFNSRKNQIEDIKEHLQQAEEETIIYEKQLSDAKSSWKEQERVFKQELQMLEGRCDDLTKQNTMLHEQMAKLSSQVVTIQQSAAREASGANTSFSDESGKTSEQLVEVIRFLRREKSIAETQLEVVQTECKRVKQKLTLKEKQEAEATRALTEERQRAQVSAETAANQVELMRKVSNLNVLTDSNKLLRDERDQILVSRQQLDARIRQLESDIEPLQSQLRDVHMQKDSLAVEKEALQEEVNRWKKRTLIEQSHKTDPEEHKRLQQEKENMRKLLGQAREENSKQKAENSRLNTSISSLQIEINSLKQENMKTGQEKENMRKLLAQTREENSKHKSEITRLNASISSMQTEMITLKQESAKTGQEVTNLKKQMEEKTKQMEEKTKQMEEKTKQMEEKWEERGTTITRLKQIGRKYKEQAEKVSKELEDVKVKAEVQEADKANAATTQQTITDLRNNGTALATQLTESQNEVQAATTRADQATAEANTLKENLNATKQDLTQTQERNTALRAEVDTFEERAAEFEKKQTQLRTVLQTARNKMMTQKTKMEKLETENRDLLSSRDDPDFVKTLQAQNESRISGLEKQLEDARRSATSETDRLQAENTELQNKVQQLQKHLENIQHRHSPPQQPMSARHGGSVTPSSTSTEAPKTANIKPMAPSTSTTRQAPPMTAHSSSLAKATASIRPMAISPTTTNLPQSGTPTATVMPTTVSQHEASTSEDNIPGPSGLQQTSLTSSTAGSTRVQIVEPQVAGEWNSDVTSSEGQGTEETVTSMADTVQVVNPTVAAPSTSSTSGEGPPHTLGVALGKRTREEESSFPEDSETKRSRLGSQEHAIPTITVIDENQQVITQIQPQLSSVSTTSHSVQAKTGIATPSTPASMKVAPSTSSVTSSSDPKDGQTGQEKQKEESAQAETERDHRGDDVIMVLSDEEDQEGAKDDNGEDDDEDEYEEEDDDDDDDDDGDDEEIEEADDNDDVVIIDIDEHQQQQQQQPQQQQQQQSQPQGGPGLSSASVRPAQAFQGHSERLTSVGRTQQLTPFLLGGPGNIFEEDDCTVPSTPTLSQPRRADGFAEALNSPAVAQRFVFGSVGEGSNNPDLAQLESQRALGMDDTRMDLSQFDETSGRSAPTTPTTLTMSAAPESVEASNEETPTMDPSELYTMDPARSQEQEGMEEEEEALLEGDGDPNEQEEEERDQGEQGDDTQHGADGASRSDLTKESTEGNQEKTDASGKPPIKKIIWDSSQASSSASAAIAQGGQGPSTAIAQQQQQQSPPAQQQQRPTQRRAQGLRRGLPTRGRNQYWASGQTRGSQFPPRGRPGRGGFRGY